MKREAISAKPSAEPKIREMTSGDAAALDGILRESPEAAQWRPRELSQGAVTGVRTWVAEKDAKVTAFLVARTAGDEAEILNLAVLPAVRRKGLGRRLLSEAILELRHAGAESIFLEVRESNSSGRAFYAAMGFVEVGRRKSYYRNPVEDGLELSRSLESVADP